MSTHEPTQEGVARDSHEQGKRAQGQSGLQDTKGGGGLGIRAEKAPTGRSLPGAGRKDGRKHQKERMPVAKARHARTEVTARQADSPDSARSTHDSEGTEGQARLSGGGAQRYTGKDLLFLFFILTIYIWDESVASSPLTRLDRSPPSYHIDVHSLPKPPAVARTDVGAPATATV